MSFTKILYIYFSLILNALFLLSYLFLALNCVMHGAFSFLKDQYISNFFCREKLLFPRRILVVRSACADNYAPNVHGFRSSNSRARYESSKDIENFQFNSFVFIFINIKVVNCLFFFLIYLCLFNYLEDHNFLCELFKIFDLIPGVFLSCQVHVNTHCVIKVISYQVCLPNFIFKIVLNFTFLSYSNMNIYLT